MPDVRLIQSPEAFPRYQIPIDWSLLDNGTLDSDQALASAVIVALGTNRLASPDDILPDPDSTDRAGWWGDMDAEELFGGWPVGTKLWLLKRAKIVGPEDPEGATVVRVEQYIREAIQPFVDLKIASTFDVEAHRVGRERIDATVVIYRGPTRPIELRFQILWNELDLWDTPRAPVLGVISLLQKLAAVETPDRALFTALAGGMATFMLAEVSDRMAVTGTMILSGTLGAIETKDNVAVTGAVPISGSMAVTEIKDNVALTGVVGVLGTLATIETTDKVAFAASTVGALGAIETKDNVALTGAVTGTMATVTAIETGDSAANSAMVAWFGTMAAIEAVGDSAASTANVAWLAPLAATELKDNVASTATVAWLAPLAATEVKDNVALTGAVSSGGFANSEVLALSTSIVPAAPATWLAAADTLVSALKTAGVWQTLDVFYGFAAPNSNACTWNWVNNSVGRLTAIGGITYSSNQYVASNGTTGRFSSTFAFNSAKGQGGNAEFGYFVLNECTTDSVSPVQSSGGDMYLGGQADATGTAIHNINAGFNTSGNAVFSSVFGSTAGHWVLQNNNTAGQLELFQDGYSTGTSTQTYSPDNGTMTLLQSTNGAFTTTRQVSFVHYGSKLTAVQQLAFSKALYNFMTAMDVRPFSGQIGVSTGPTNAAPYKHIPLGTGDGSVTIPGPWGDAQVQGRGAAAYPRGLIKYADPNFVNLWRLEIWAGDEAPWDIGNGIDRCLLNGLVQIPWQTNVDLAYSVWMENASGFGSATSWIIGPYETQDVLQYPGPIAEWSSPASGLGFGRYFVHGYFGDTDVHVNNPPTQHVAFSKGAWHNVRITFRADASPNGFCQAWFDGTQILNWTNNRWGRVDGMPMRPVMSFWRGQNATSPPAAIWVANFEYAIGSQPFASRIASPLPCPAMGFVSRGTAAGTGTATGVSNVPANTFGLIENFSNVNGVPGNYRIDGFVTGNNTTHTWSTTQIDAYTVRFEIRSGDHWSAAGGSYTDGTSVERDELDWEGYLLNEGVLLNFECTITILPGPAITSPFFNLIQLHASTNVSPTYAPFSIMLLENTERVQVVLEEPAQSGNNYIYTAPTAIVRGQPMNFKCKVKMGPTGNGSVFVTLNGNTIVNAPAVKVGATSSTYYWKCGFYRTSSSETVKGDYSHIHMYTG